MRVLFECDQCTYQEWRDEADEPYLCPVCGYYRWNAVQTKEEEAASDPDRMDEEPGTPG